jgi:cytochrome c oxidase assembly protein subunit 15
VVVQVGIVITGGMVRLTGSGLGCTTAPQCTPGNLTPVENAIDGMRTWIEFGNRLLTFVVGIVVIACIVAAWRHRPRRKPLVVLAALGLVGVFGQALLGMVTVWTGLNPVTVAAHFLLSMVLIAIAVTLVERGNDAGDGPPVVRVRRELHLLTRAIVAVSFIVLVVGTIVTGTGPHAGDADDPPRLPFDLGAVSWLHADLVLVLIGLVAALVLGLKLTGAPAAVIRRTWFLVAMILVQGFIGYIQYATGLPIGVVALHLLGACLVWVATLRVYLSMRTREPVSATTDTAMAAAD